MDLDLAQLRALDATVRGGTLEAAARALHVTPSAISQRLRALEVATGRILLVRTKPVQVTESGQAVLRLARQVDLLAADVARELGGNPPHERVPTLPIAVNADSMATWVLPALTPLAGDVCFDLYREDQAHTSALLRAGTVMAAVTAGAEPGPGCTPRRGARPAPDRRLRPQGRPAAPLPARTGRSRRRATGALRARRGGLRRRDHPRPGLGHGARPPGARSHGGAGRPRPRERDGRRPVLAAVAAALPPTRPRPRGRAGSRRPRTRPARRVQALIGPRRLPPPRHVQVSS